MDTGVLVVITMVLYYSSYTESTSLWIRLSVGLQFQSPTAHFQAGSLSEMKVNNSEWSIYHIIVAETSCADGPAAVVWLM